jgi:Na+/proline symporter
VVDDWDLIMATQASAVTFLSTPGQAIEDGMRFIQFYFGLPLAMVIISVTMVPIYYRLKVYTAYEYLETRFDLKTRSLAAILFPFVTWTVCRDNIVRASADSIHHFALAVVSYHTANRNFCNYLCCIGGFARVNLTQRYQMAIIMGGMILAGILAFNLLPQGVSFSDSVNIAVSWANSI